VSNRKKAATKIPTAGIPKISASKPDCEVDIDLSVLERRSSTTLSYLIGTESWNL
jgi:hypothetical protein